MRSLKFASVLSKPKSGIKKHVQFGDETSCMEEASVAVPEEPEKPGEGMYRVIKCVVK
ncbi:hypothetical protein JYU34_000278 [Plutella xylostella]|uniref:Uncharacterized protein n=1 Tax=Plutella xylostella TaxID=51655 RepID=A0ABQ7R7A7_PLUXY|nr:hypothetical protein JYU34_000278 [Plutella xylostella]